MSQPLAQRGDGLEKGRTSCDGASTSAEMRTAAHNLYAAEDRLGGWEAARAAIQEALGQAEAAIDALDYMAEDLNRRACGYAPDAAAARARAQLEHIVQSARTVRDTAAAAVVSAGHRHGAAVCAFDLATSTDDALRRVSSTFEQEK